MAKLLRSDQQLLVDWAAQVVQMFNGEMVYQVGTSVSPLKQHRDIDLRVMLEPQRFKALQEIVDVDRLSVAVSLWGQKVTALPIDFQIQDRDFANVHHRGQRSAIGLGGVPKGDGYALADPTDERGNEVPEKIKPTAIDQSKEDGFDSDSDYKHLLVVGDYEISDIDDEAQETPEIQESKRITIDGVEYELVPISGQEAV